MCAHSLVMQQLALSIAQHQVLKARRNVRDKLRWCTTSQSPSMHSGRLWSRPEQEPGKVSDTSFPPSFKARKPWWQLQPKHSRINFTIRTFRYCRRLLVRTSHGQLLKVEVTMYVFSELLSTKNNPMIFSLLRLNRNQKRNLSNLSLGLTPLNLEILKS